MSRLLVRRFAGFCWGRQRARRVSTEGPPPVSVGRYMLASQTEGMPHSIRSAHGVDGVHQRVDAGPVRGAMSAVTMAWPRSSASDTSSRSAGSRWRQPKLASAMVSEG